MRIAIGADHAGYDLKAHLVTVLRNLDHTVLDLGTDGTESVDYPAFCAAVGRAVARGDAERGIVLGGSGQGEQIAANKVKGLRAALCLTPEFAELARLHNDARVLSLGGRFTALEEAERIVKVFLVTEFTGEARHQRRIDMLEAYESDGTLPPLPSHP